MKSAAPITPWMSTFQRDAQEPETLLGPVEEPLCDSKVQSQNAS